MNARDKRANSLKLNPRPKQTNSFRFFECGKAKTDIEIVEGDRIGMCVGIRNGDRRK
jgi:hypothetical protein